MLAARKVARERLELLETSVPAPADGEVLVGVRACGVCASDLLGWRSATVEPATPGRWNASNPGVTGHEIAGEIVAVGHDVAADRIGEAVWIDPVVGCGACEACSRAEQTFCPSYSVVCQGFAEFVVAPATQCLPIPEGFDYTTASLIGDMVGTPVAAAKRAALSAGETVAVWGLGPVGLGLVQAARIEGATTIAGVDPVSSRRHLAASLGAGTTIDPSNGDAVDTLRNANGSRGVDVVLCSVGQDQVATQAFDALRLGGRMVTVAGFPPAGGDVAKWVSGSWACDAKYWDEILGHLTARRFVLDSYVSHTFDLRDIQTAFELRARDLEKSLKVVVTMGKPVA
jgi:propanol-preferring alcohol dehydrogenase